MAREFFFEITDGLVNGLRNNTDNNKNSKLLTECLNAEPTPFGLVGHDLIVQNVIPNLDIDFPFPQLFKGENITLVAEETKIYELDESNFNITELGLINYKDASLAATIPVGGGSWHFIDFGDAWALLNSVVIVFRTNRIDNVGGRSKVMVADSSDTDFDVPPISTGMSHRGRTILAGFDDSFWSEELKSLFELFLDDLPVEVDKTYKMGKNFVMWSSIGGGIGDINWFLYPEDIIEGEIQSTGMRAFGILEFTAQPSDLDTITIDGIILTYKDTPIADTDIDRGADEGEAKDNTITKLNTDVIPRVTGSDISTVSVNRIQIETLSVGTYGNSITTVSGTAAVIFSGATLAGGVDSTIHGTNDSLFMENLKLNQWGFKPMSFQGKVLLLKELGRNIIVYGEDGIDTMIQSDPRDTSFVGYNFNELSKIGLHSRSAVGGSLNQHLFIDTKGVLWTIILSRGIPVIQRLGFEEFFKPMVDTGREIMISYEENENRFFISDNENGFAYRIVGETGGLYQIKQLVTSVVFFQGEAFGIFEDTGEEEFRITTDIQDNNIAARKFITEVVINADINDPAEIKLQIQYRYNRKDQFRKSRWVRFNDEGSAFINTVAVEYKIVISGTPFELIDKLSSVIIKWQPLDRSKVRGTSSNVIQADSR